MMPAIAPRELVRNLDNVLTLLQPAQIYLLPTVPEDENAWPPERNMLIWKDERNRWHFKMLLLGEQHQGMFDISIEDDHRVVDCLNTLEINLEASEEISDKLGPDLLARIARPYLSLSYSQQNLIRFPLDLSAVWPLDNDEPVDANIQTCLALLRGERGNDFSDYLTLAHINQLAGGRVAEFCETNPDVTSGDVLRFIQLLLRAAAKEIGHDEAVVLPAPPEGSDILFSDAPREVDNDGTPLLQVFRLVLRIIRADTLRVEFPRITPEIQEAIDIFETVLIDLEESSPNLSEQDRELLTQSLTTLRAAKTAWFSSDKDMSDLLNFRRATDAVLREQHIQRLYTRRHYPRLGMFSDYVASPETPELQRLRLNLRELRDFSMSRISASKSMKRLREILFQIFAAGIVLMLVAIGGLGVMTAVVALPGLGLLAACLVYGYQSALFLLITFIYACIFEFSLDLWNAKVEAFRELITEELPLTLGVALVSSLGYGLLAGELSTATGMLAAAGMVFSGAFLSPFIVLIGVVSAAIAMTLTVGITVAIVTFALGYLGYMASMISEYIEDWSSGFNPDEPVHEGVEGTGLAPT